MTKINFIYFDIGGVLIQDFSDTNKWHEMYADLGMTPDQIIEIDKLYSKFKRKFMTVLEIDAFIPLLKKDLGITLPADYSMLADFVARFTPNKSIWPALKSIQAQYRTGLLTNMYPNMLDAIKAADLMPPAKWDVTVDSSVEGVQKPDSVIYQIATKWAGVPHEEILFIDNTEKNVKRAESVGWQTFHYDSSDYKQASADLSSFLKV